MLLIPELQTVIILVPRTGTGSLKRAVLDRYPQSKLIYRHMEADGVPFGYDRWRRLGVARNPVDRAWSLYKFLRDPGDAKWSEGRRARQAASVDRPFEDWLMNNDVPFSDHVLFRDYNPLHAVRHPIPENRKSQFVHLRPDLGTAVFGFDHLQGFAETYLDVELPRKNATPADVPPLLSPAAADYVRRVFRWEIELLGYNFSVS